MKNRGASQEARAHSPARPNGYGQDAVHPVLALAAEFWVRIRLARRVNKSGLRVLIEKIGRLPSEFDDAALQGDGYRMGAIVGSEDLAARLSR